MNRYGSSTARVAGPGRVNDPVPRQGTRHGCAGNCATGGGAGASAEIGDADAAPVHGTREVTVWAVDVVVHAGEGGAPEEGVPDAVGPTGVGAAENPDRIGSRVLGS